MIVVIFFLIISGLYQSYDMDGLQIMILFMMSNFYVILLQFLWRFTGEDEEATESANKNIADGSFESAKEKLGMNYFDKNTEIEFSRSPSSSPLTKKDQKPELGYIRFNDDDVVEDKRGFANNYFTNVNASPALQFPSSNDHFNETGSFEDEQEDPAKEHREIQNEFFTKDV